MWNDGEEQRQGAVDPSIKGTSNSQGGKRNELAQGGVPTSGNLLSSRPTPAQREPREWAHHLGGVCWSIIRRSLQIPAARGTRASKLSFSWAQPQQTEKGRNQRTTLRPNKSNTTRTQARLGCADQKSTGRSLRVKYNFGQHGRQTRIQNPASPLICRHTALQIASAAVSRFHVRPPIACERTLADTLGLGPHRLL